MKIIFALLIASSAILAINGQRETTWGPIERDSVVRFSDRINGTAPLLNHAINVDRTITGIRTTDLTGAGVSTVVLVSGLNSQVAVFNFNTLGPGQMFDVRITIFSGSSIIHASSVIMMITLLFSYLMK